MTPEHFAREHAETWARFDALLARFEGRRRRADGDEDAAGDAEFPQLYRQVCYHLSLARDRRMPAYLVDALHERVLRGHQTLYGARASSFANVARGFFGDFPRALRAESRLLALSVLLFFGPLLGVGAAVHLSPDLVYAVLAEHQVRSVEEMYDPDNGPGIGRDADSDVLMFGFYIRNNVGIAFRTFAGGLLFGLGTLAVLIFNGVYIGVVAGHLTRIGSGVPFTSFVVGHGAFELTAIAIAGVTGLMLGRALISPGRHRRSRALVIAARRAIPIVYGMAGMLAIAALIEAFWSPRAGIPPEIKWAVGAVLWIGVVAWLALGGRRRAA